MSKHPKQLVKKANSNAETIYQVRQQILTREDVRATLDVLFENAGKAREQGRGLAEKHFLQTPGAQTMAPNLQAPPPVEEPEQASFASMAMPSKVAASKEWLEKMTRSGVKRLASGGSKSKEKALKFVPKNLMSDNPKRVGAGRAAMDQLTSKETSKAMKTKVSSVAKHTLAYFEKQANQAGLTEAQKRYPELLKVADGTASGPAPRPSVVQPKKAGPSGSGGPTPVRSPLSGGAA